MATHELDTTVDTCHWGFYDSDLAPVMTIASGDTLVVKTESGRKDFLKKYPERLSENLRKILETMEPNPGAHIMTGPVAIEGAEPGDVLEIKIRDIRPRYDWGYNGFRPLVGGLPEDFPYTRMVVVEVDEESGTGDWGAGVDGAARAFFREFRGWRRLQRLGVCPRFRPGEWGGNTDCKEFTAGSTIYLPIFNEGALFSRGRRAWLSGGR